MFRLILILALFLVGCGKEKELSTPTLASTAQESEKGVSQEIILGGSSTYLRLGTTLGDHGLIYYKDNEVVGSFYMDSQLEKAFLIFREKNGWANLKLSYNGLVIRDKNSDEVIRLKDNGTITIEGVQVLGPQQPAIANSDGSQEDNARAINELLEAYRNHGSIARGGADLAVKN